MITNEQLTEIKQRAEKATISPRNNASNFGCIATFDEDLICGEIERNDDAEFIAHARKDIPTLVTEVERLTAENERLDGLYSEKYMLVTHYKNAVYEQSKEIKRLRKALTNIELTTESNAYRGISVEATMRNRAHKALHDVEPEEVSPNE